MIVALSPCLQTVYHADDILDVKCVLVVVDSQPHHDPLQVRQYGIARSDSLADRKPPLLPFRHAERIDRVRYLDIVEQLVSQLLKMLAPHRDEELVLGGKLSFCEELMLDKIIDPVSQLKVNLLELDLTLVTLTFYNTHSFYQSFECDPTRGPQ